MNEQHSIYKSKNKKDSANVESKECSIKSTKIAFAVLTSLKFNQTKHEQIQV